ncbi:MAG TPA: dihydropyrimidinase [Kiritimatiellia bacterium]|nr:dihydropyrimidinase [Kiritimatiellia bacterium]HRZ12457.1 dihydropyrimidinase [Kiritimatiellia bacterium]HSA17785.1 dihydropyrimidinase [Kiritimatiellia bacterium]
MSIVIKGGTIVTAGDLCAADLRIDGEQIVEIGRDLPAKAGDTVVSAKGRYLFPGGVDVHTHFELPFMGTVSADDFKTGPVAALCGGTTTYIDFCMQAKGKPLAASLAAWHEKAKKSAADFGFHMGIVDYTPAVAAEIPAVIKQGVSSFKFFMAYKGALQIDDGQIIGIMETVGRNGGLSMVHAENGDMIDTLSRRFIAEGKQTPEYHWLAHPAIAEEEAVHRIVELARFTEQTIYIVHLSSADGLEKVKEAVARGYPVIAETCPQYLLLSSDLYYRPNFEGAKWVMSPPLRPADHLEKMWEGLGRGFIKTVATDHCSFNFKGQKEMGRDSFAKIPNGIPSVGDRFNLLYTYGVGQGRMSLTRFADVVATAPAKIFGMYPRKGTLAVGSDADVVIFNPEAKGVVSAKTTKHNVDYSAYEGLELKGLPESVLLRGKFAVRDGQYVGEQGAGRFIARGPAGKMV